MKKNPEESEVIPKTAAGCEACISLAENCKNNSVSD
jgi:hypothetical protein